MNTNARSMKLQFALTGTPMSLVIEALKAEFTEDTLGIIAKAISVDTEREDLRSEIESHLAFELDLEVQNKEALESLTSYFSDTAFDVEMFANMKLNSASVLLHMYSVISLVVEVKNREANA
jgi:hypothetical protein